MGVLVGGYPADCRFVHADIQGDITQLVCRGLRLVSPDSGQMHVNTGYQEAVHPLVRRFLDVFGDAETIVAPSASCVATVRHLYREMAVRSGDAQLVRDVDAVVPRLRELTEYLIDDRYAERLAARLAANGVDGWRGESPLEAMAAHYAAADFVLKRGNDADPANWIAAPEPLSRHAGLQQ